MTNNSGITLSKVTNEMNLVSGMFVLETQVLASKENYDKIICGQ